MRLPTEHEMLSFGLWLSLGCFVASVVVITLVFGLVPVRTDARFRIDLFGKFLTSGLAAIFFTLFTLAAFWHQRRRHERTLAEEAYLEILRRNGEFVLPALGVEFRRVAMLVFYSLPIGALTILTATAFRYYMAVKSLL